MPSACERLRGASPWAALCLTLAVWLLPLNANAQPTPDEPPGDSEPAAAPTPEPSDAQPSDAQPAEPLPADPNPPAQPTAAPLVVAEPAAAAPAARPKGQRGHELHDARYRVDTDVLTAKRKRRPRREALDDARVGMTLSGGGLLTPGLSQGWYGRLDGTALSGYPGEWHQVIGVQAGLEYWSASNGSGGGIPAAFRVGLVGPLTQFAIDLGAETLIFDDRNDDFGFGIYAPFARGVLGFDFGGVALLVDSQVQYRWQWGAPDFADYRMGVSISLLGEPPPAPPPEAR